MLDSELRVRSRVGPREGRSPLLSHGATGYSHLQHSKQVYERAGCERANVAWRIPTTGLGSADLPRAPAAVSAAEHPESRSRKLDGDFVDPLEFTHLG